MMKKTPLCLLILMLSATLLFSREPKEYDSNLIYDEDKIPHYDLPPLLVTVEGKPVTTAEQWRNIRRPQILSLFSNLVYGRVPEPESPIAVEFLKGIHRLFYKKGQSFPKAREWGALSAVAWGAMRAMDYLETDTDIDHTRVAIMGHSKMGKATLWTAAQDERFALAISAQSGCAGAGARERRWKRWSRASPTGSVAMPGSS